MKIKKFISNLYSNYGLNILGITMLSYFIWYRFLRERLPKNIPFELTELSFYIIIYICCFYAYILLRMHKPKLPNKFIVELLQFLSKLYTPWSVLDETIKNNNYVIKIYSKMLGYIPGLLKYYKTPSKTYKLYIVFIIIPRFIILVVFCLDVFYFHRLYYVFKFSFLILLILIWKYIIYSITKTSQYCETYLDQWYLVEITSRDSEDISDDNYFTPHSSFDWSENDQIIIEELPRFLPLQTCAISFDYTLYSYISKPRNIRIEQFAMQNNMKISDIEDKYYELEPKISEEFYDVIPTLIYLYLLIENYQFTCTKDKDVKKFNILIISVYLVCWIYILYVSFNIELLNTIFTILDKIEPFSGIYL